MLAQNEVRTMTDINTKDVETQKPNGGSASTCSSVKTPLVDTLRSFFNIPEAIEGQPAIHR